MTPLLLLFVDAGHDNAMLALPALGLALVGAAAAGAKRGSAR